MSLSFFAQTAEAEKTPSGGSIAEADSSACSDVLMDVVGRFSQDSIADELTFAGEWTREVLARGTLG